MFVDTKELIAVELFYKKNEKGRNLIVLRNLDLLGEDAKKTFTKVTMKMRPMNWKIYNDLQRESMVDKGTGDGEHIDWVKYKEIKLLKLLAEWDAKDKDSNKIQINQETINSLHPLMAEFALSEYDKKSILSDE